MPTMERAGAVSESGQARAGVRNRRVERTRRTIVQSFNALFFERGYARVTVREIVSRADIGRATFYEHFGNKHDVLEAALEPVFAPLAAAVDGARAEREVAAVLAHIDENRRFAAQLLGGASRALVQRVLAELVERRLAERARSAGVPRSFVANAVAGAQLALIEWWLDAEPAARRALPAAHAMVTMIAAMVRATSAEAPAGRRPMGAVRGPVDGST